MLRGAWRNGVGGGRTKSEEFVGVMGSRLAWRDFFFFVKSNFQYKLSFFINCKCISKEIAATAKLFYCKSCRYFL